MTCHKKLDLKTVLKSWDGIELSGSKSKCHLLYGKTGINMRHDLVELGTWRHNSKKHLYDDNFELYCEGRLIGLCRLTAAYDDEWIAQVQMDAITIHPDWRRQGLGSQLLRHSFLQVTKLLRTQAIKSKAQGLHLTFLASFTSDSGEAVFEQAVQAVVDKYTVEPWEEFEGMFQTEVFTDADHEELEETVFRATVNGDVEFLQQHEDRLADMEPHDPLYDALLYGENDQALDAVLFWYGIEEHQEYLFESGWWFFTLLLTGIFAPKLTSDDAIYLKLKSFLTDESDPGSYAFETLEKWQESLEDSPKDAKIQSVVVLQAKREVAKLSAEEGLSLDMQERIQRLSHFCSDLV
ncbi:GNAT family N-acetyltransferase [Vibrio harveyi]|uniref:GNAT family N-acetyltransferase n=1 Tax=Vibrio harveyi TaxID=669 RepID=UPI003BB5B80A